MKRLFQVILSLCFLFSVSGTAYASLDLGIIRESDSYTISVDRAANTATIIDSAETDELIFTTDADSNFKADNIRFDILIQDYFGTQKAVPRLWIYFYPTDFQYVTDVSFDIDGKKYTCSGVSGPDCLEELDTGVSESLCIAFEGENLAFLKALLAVEDENATYSFTMHGISNINTSLPDGFFKCLGKLMNTLNEMGYDINEAQKASAMEKLDDQGDVDQDLFNALLAAQKNDDADAAIAAIHETYEANGNAGAISATILDLISHTVLSMKYEDYLFADQIVQEFADFSSDASAILDSAFENRAKAFLLGDWVRNDGTRNTKMKINVRVSDDDVIGILTYAPSSAQFKGNENKWADFSFYDQYVFTYEDLGSNGFWVYSNGTVDYDNECLLISTGAPGRNFQLGADQYWIKQSYIDKYGEGVTLNTEDFKIEHWDGEKYTVQDCNYSIYNSYIFPHFFDDGSAPGKDMVRLRDGIALGSSREDVMRTYGVGIGRKYSSSTNPLRSVLANNKLTDDLAAYDEQVAQMVYQDDSGKKCLVFGFNAQNELCFLSVVPAYMYWK